MMDPNQYLRMQNLFGIGQPPIMGPDPNNPLHQFPRPMDEIPRPNIPDGQMQPSGMPPPYSGPTVPPAPPLGPPMETLPNGGQLPQIAKAASSSPDQQPDMTTRFNQLYQPEHAAIDKYTKLLDQYPDASAKENRPPWWRAAIGGLQAVASGMAPGRGMDFYQMNPEGMKAGMDYVNAPFNNKMMEWRRLTDATKDAANIERQSNVNARSGANQILSQEMREREITRKETSDKNRLEIQQGNQRLQYLKAQMPSYKWDLTGPTVMVMDTKTGKPTDTGFLTHNLDPLTKLMLEQEGDMAKIAAQGANAAEVAGINQTGAEKRETMGNWILGEIPDRNNPGQKITVWVNPNTQETKPVMYEGQNVSGFEKVGTDRPVQNRPETEQARRIRERTNALNIRNSRTDLRNFIRLGTGTDFTVTHPGTNWFGSPTGPTAEQFQEINELIQAGGSAQGTEFPSQFNKSATSPTPTTPAPSQMAPSQVPPPTASTNRPAQAPKPTEQFQPRGEYTSKAPKSPAQSPWIVDKAKEGYGALTKKSEGPPAENVYQKQVMGPNGPVTIPPGKVAIRDVNTGEMVQIPRENLTRALATKQYTEVK